MKKIKFSLLLTLALSITTSIMPGTKAKAAGEPPTIQGLAAVTLDYETGEIIYAKNIDDKMYPASTTKLMTAILFAENKQKTDTITYTEDAYKQPAYSLRSEIYFNLKVGDTMSAADVMNAMLLFSGNDTAYMVADAVAGDATSFVKMMNDKAKELGMTNTNFVTANGLHDPNHYSTAYDLAILGTAAYKNEWVRESIGTKEAKITLLSTGQPAYIENRNKLLGVDGNLGGKTGYTSPAGKCLVSIYERDGRKIVGVVLKAPYDEKDTAVFNDMKKIIDYSYGVEKSVLKEKNSELGTAELQYKVFKFFGPTKTIKVPYIIKDDVTYYENDLNKEETKLNVQLNDIDPWKLSTDKSIGKLLITQRDSQPTRNVDIYPTISSDALISANKGLYIGAAVAGIAILAVLIFIIAIIKKSASKRRRRNYF
ncbi:MAG: D-alanyl-D-alanine carboxypeptidase [Clostridiales bacterium]|uniref:D-alanyl-D-alanine carboxypeptidase family protein n=1 Tax=Clostridium sp. N3C TaxID=1776758 RepID=UPI00092DF8AC|nr:D-alanyl-D-alanine carboxypeptidase family protein [Clostridium sp. N3C]NLZ49424.1 D-alanyl-D-alanine carboxypeptidase [Clostridiales bacterium]SCN25196.1 D-alanyl-D-alanine carboxypeptidase DacC precursor [Clostridium sp. N3C]